MIEQGNIDKDRQGARHPLHAERFLIARNRAPGLVSAADFVELAVADGNPLVRSPALGAALASCLGAARVC